MGKRLYEDRFNCGHTRAEWNCEREAIRNGVVSYRCIQCRRRKNRDRYKPKPKNLGDTFPCGHPRTKQNSALDSLRRSKKHPSKFIKRTAVCRTCRNASRLARYFKDNENEKRRKGEPRRVMGSIIVGRCYESDEQCECCGYTLRYSRAETPFTNRKGQVVDFPNRCVVCEREKSRTRNGRRRLLIAVAKKQHAKASAVNRPARKDLTDMEEMRQDGPP